MVNKSIILLFVYIFQTIHANAADCDNYTCVITGFNDNVDLNLSNSIQNLTVIKNQKSKIPEWVKNFTQLKSLHIRDSGLSDFSLVEPMQSLTGLDLSRNEVQKLTRKSLNFYPNLQYLNLSHNKIKSIEDFAFTGMSSIVTLDLSVNQLRKLSAPLSARPLLDLKVLRLDNNRLEELSEDLFDTLFKLELLSLAGNYLKFISERTLRPMYYLEELQLQDNYLHSITFENQKLQSLNLSGNQLVAENISGLSKSRLIELDLSRNPLGKFENLSLNEMENLETLTMNRMSLISIKTFNAPKSLRILSLRNNDYPNISTVNFSSLPRLNLLQIDGNRLNNIDPSNLPTSLTYIGLSNNNFNCSYLDTLLKTLRVKGVRLYLDSSDNDKNIEGEISFIQDVICFNDDPEGIVVKSCKIIEENFVYAWHTTLVTVIMLALALTYVIILWVNRHELKKIKDKEAGDVEEVQSLTFHDLLSKDSNEF